MVKINCNSSIQQLLVVAFLLVCQWTLPLKAKATSKTPTKAKGSSHHHKNGTSHHKSSTCEPLLIPSCKALNLYTHVNLPNSLGHSSQHEINRAFKKFAPMLRTSGCGEWLSVLLCLTYAPPCPNTKGMMMSSSASSSLRAAPACRQLCASAWAGCWTSMEKAGLSWPHALDCELMPIGADEDGQECVMRKGRLVNHTSIPTETSTHTKRTPTVKTSLAATSKPQTTKTNSTKKSNTSKKHKPVTKSVGKNKKALKAEKISKPEVNDGSYSEKKVNSSKHSSVETGMQHNNHMKITKNIKPRRYDIEEMGDNRMFHGWADVQGQGAANDYCRVIGRSSKHRFLSCALAGGSGHDHMFVSRRGFDVGHDGSWFMRDMDKDGRDDYCRCVGRGLSSRIACMKAGKHGFFGSLTQPGSMYTFYVKARSSCYGKTYNSALGPTFKI